MNCRLVLSSRSQFFLTRIVASHAKLHWGSRINSSRSAVLVINTSWLIRKPARSGTLRAFVWVVLASEFVSALRMLYLHLKVVCYREACLACASCFAFHSA